MKSPCYKCPDRSMTCHFEGNCEKNDEYQKYLSEFKKKVYEERLRDYPARKREREAKLKAWKRNHR